MSQFHFTDQQWREYQEMPDQGYSHRGFLEDAVNTGLAETIRQAKEQAWKEGANTAIADYDLPELKDIHNPYRSQP